MSVRAPYGTSDWDSIAGEKGLIDAYAPEADQPPGGRAPVDGTRNSREESDGSCSEWPTTRPKRSNATSVRRYTTVVSVSAGSGAGSPYISHAWPADSLRFAFPRFGIGREDASAGRAELVCPVFFQKHAAGLPAAVGGDVELHGVPPGGPTAPTQQGGPPPAPDPDVREAHDRTRRARALAAGRLARRPAATERPAEPALSPKARAAAGRRECPAGTSG